jgi:hypothetical protein
MLYIPETQTIIRSHLQRYSHPQTGEIYGGTDYDDPTKLAEIGAIPLTSVHEDHDNSDIENGTTITVSEDGLSATQTYKYRARTTEENDQYIATIKTDRIQQIDNKTKELIQEGFIYNNYSFSMSDAAQRNWLMIAVGVALGMVNENSLPVASTLEEVPYVFQSMNDVQGFLAAFASYNSSPSAPLAIGRELKASIVAATTIEEINNIIDTR